MKPHPSEFLKAEDILKQAIEMQHRFSPEPVFSKGSTGFLSPRSTKDSAITEKHILEQAKMLKKRAKRGNTIELER